MKRGVVAFLGVALGLSLVFPAGTPALEASYELTANRWTQGVTLYTKLQAPVDPLFTYLYRLMPEDGGGVLRLWKAWGLLAAGLFFLRSYLSQPPSFLQQAVLGVWLAAYALQRWTHPFAVGMPALWTLLLLYPNLRQPFAQGILWAGLSYLFPQATLFGLWVIYRRIEERDLRALGLFGMGGAWALLAALALHQHVSEPKSYGAAYWLAVWQSAYTPWEWLLVLSAGALLLVWLQSGLYFRRPYVERLAYRDRLWAAITSLLAADPAAFGAWMALGMESFSNRLRQLVVLGLFGMQSGLLFYAFSKLPACISTLPAQSCLWGTPPCYVRLEGPYGCDITSPFYWQRIWSRADWIQLYRSWGDPSLIWDAARSWAEVQYHLPNQARAFARKDTLLPSPLLLYQRR